MKKRMVFIGIIVIGVVTLLFGLYFLMIKAGIPYQDPTPEMLTQYNTYTQTGKTLTMIGLGTIFADIILAAIYKTLHRPTA